MRFRHIRYNVVHATVQSEQALSYFFCKATILNSVYTNASFQTLLRLDYERNRNKMTNHEVSICSELVCVVVLNFENSFASRFNRYRVLVSEHCILIMSIVFFSLPVKISSTFGPFSCEVVSPNCVCFQRTPVSFQRTPVSFRFSNHL